MSNIVWDKFHWNFYKQALSSNKLSATWPSWLTAVCTFFLLAGSLGSLQLQQLVSILPLTLTKLTISTKGDCYYKDLGEYLKVDTFKLFNKTTN